MWEACDFSVRDVTLLVDLKYVSCLTLLVQSNHIAIKHTIILLLLLSFQNTFFFNIQLYSTVTCSLKALESNLHFYF